MEFNNRRESERTAIVVMFGKVQNFFLSTVIIEMNIYIFHFLFSCSFLFFFPLLIELYTQANKNQNIVKRSNDNIRTIEIVLILSFKPLLVPFLTQTSLLRSPTGLLKYIVASLVHWDTRAGILFSCCVFLFLLLLEK